MATGKVDRFWILPYVGWFTTILWLSLDSSPPNIDLGALTWDKLEHAAAYALLTLLGLPALGPFFRHRRTAVLAVLTISILLGAALEIGQGVLTSTRFADPLDLLANTLGALAALAIFHLPQLRAARRKQSL